MRTNAVWMTLGVLALIGPAMAVPINYVETWDGYATGSDDPAYSTNWAVIAGQSRFPIITPPPPASTPPDHTAGNSLEQQAGIAFGIENNLADGVELPIGGYVVPTAGSPLKVGTWWNPANTSGRQTNSFILELCSGGTPQVGIANDRVAPGAGNNNAYYFNGTTWIRQQAAGVFKSQGWSEIFLTLTPAAASGYDVSLTLTGNAGTSTIGVGSITYAGGFDSLRVRSMGDSLSASWIDEVYLAGGQIVPEPATLALLCAGGLCLRRRRR